MYFNKKISPIILLFVLATIAYSLFYLLIITYNRPRGFHGYVDGFFYGYFMHFPLWFISLAVGWKLNKSYLKLNLFKFWKVILFLLIILIIAPLIITEVNSYFSYVFLPFLIANYFLNLLIISRIDSINN